MLAKATEFGCSADDVACMCKTESFNFGIRDCSIESCGNVDQANIVISWGNSLCTGAGVTTGTTPPASSVNVSIIPLHGD
jgi:hypothetical protein